MRVGGWKIRCSFPSFMSSEECVVLWGGKMLQLEVEARFSQGKSVYCWETSRAAAARFTLSTCFDLNRTERFFFFLFPLPQGQTWSGICCKVTACQFNLSPQTSLCSFDTTHVQTLRWGHWRSHVWKVSVQDQLLSTQCVVANWLEGRKTLNQSRVSVWLLCVEILKSKKLLSEIWIALMVLSNGVDVAWLFQVYHVAHQASNSNKSTVSPYLVWLDLKNHNHCNYVQLTTELSHLGFI